MLLAINAQTAGSVGGFGTQIELRGREHPLGRAEGAAGNEKTPTHRSAAKWDVNALSPSGETQRAPWLTRCTE